MNSNETPELELERTLHDHFEAEAARLRAPNDLWERIESRLEDRPDPEERVLVWLRIFSPTQWRPLPALITAVVLLIAVSGAWLFTAAPWEGGEPGRPRALMPAAPAAAPTPTPAPRQPAATTAPMPTIIAPSQPTRFDNCEVRRDLLVRRVLRVPLARTLLT